MKQIIKEFYTPDNIETNDSWLSFDWIHAYPFLKNPKIENGKLQIGEGGDTHRDLIARCLFGHDTWDCSGTETLEIPKLKGYDIIEGRIWILNGEIGDTQAFISTWDGIKDKDTFMEVCNHFNVDPKETLYGYGYDVEPIDMNFDDLDTFADELAVNYNNGNNSIQNIKATLFSQDTPRQLTPSKDDVAKRAEQVKIKHNLPPEEKWGATADFRDTVAHKNAEKLGNMSMAQYHNLIYQEEKQYHPEAEDGDEYKIGFDGFGNADDFGHIVEAITKKVLLEGKDRKQQARKRTRQVITDYFNGRLNVNEPNAMTNGLPLIDFLEQEVLHDFFHSRSRQDAKGKFICLEPMVARIILNAGWQQDQPDNGVIARLQSILNYIEELYLQGQIDPQTDIPLDSTIESLNETFGKTIDEREANEAEARNDKEFTVNEDYDILDDVSYEQAHEIGNYSYSGLRLCYTQSSSTWKNSFDGEKNKVYVCLSKGWKDIPEEHGNSLLEQYPDADAYDEYGLSMIFIFVNQEGDLVYSNTRWNHQATYGNGRSVDHAFTKDDLSDLLGVNFDERFKGYTEEELEAKRVTFEKIEQMLVQGIDLAEIFDYVGNDRNGFKTVSFQNKYNFVTPNNQLLSHRWFDYASEFNNGLGVVKLNGKYNFVDENNQFLSTQWFDVANAFHNGFGVIKLNNKWNYIKADGTFLWNKPIEQWFDKVYSFNGSYGCVDLNNKCNIIRKDGTLVWNHPVEEWFDCIANFGENTKILESKKKINVIDCQSGNLLFKNWINNIDLTYLFPTINGQKKQIRVTINGILCAMTSDGNIKQMWQSDVCGLEKSLYYDKLAEDVWKWLYDEHNGDIYGYWDDLWEFYKTRKYTDGLTGAAEKYAKYKIHKKFGQNKLSSNIINIRIEELTQDAFVALQKATIYFFNYNPIEEPIDEATHSKKVYINEDKLSLLKENGNFFSVPMIDYNSEQYFDDDEDAVPFAVLYNKEILYGKKGTYHHSNENINSINLKDIELYGRLFLTENGHNIIIIGIGSGNHKSWLEPNVILSVVNKVTKHLHLDPNSVYYYVDRYDNAPGSLTKLVPEADDSLTKRYEELSKRRGDELEAKWRAEKYQESKVNKLYPLTENIDMEVSPEEIDTSSFEIQDELQPEIWRDNQLNPQIRLKLLDIADDFFDTLDISWIKPIDIILTGSICNFNWSKYSDIDLHLVIDFREVSEQTDFVQTFFDSKKNEWNDQHKDLQVFGFPIEVYVQDIDNMNISNGIYSLNKDKWIQEPNRSEMSDLDNIDELKLKLAASSIMTVIDNIEKEFNSTEDKHQLEVLNDKIDYLSKKIKALRQNGLNNNGEMSTANLVYKVLRRTEYLDKMWNLSDKIYDKVNSIE